MKLAIAGAVLVVAIGAWWVWLVTRGDDDSDLTDLRERWWWCPADGSRMCTSEGLTPLGDLPQQRPKSWAASQCLGRLSEDVTCVRTSLVFCRTRRVNPELGCYLTKRTCADSATTDGDLPCVAFVDGFATY